MKMPFTKLELAGAVLLVGGPIVYFAANQMSLRESAQGNPTTAVGNAMTAYRDVASTSVDVSQLMAGMSRASGAIAESGEKVLLHNARAYTWARVANGGYALFLLGVGLFLIGLRQRFLALAANNSRDKEAVAQHATPDS